MIDVSATLFVVVVLMLAGLILDRFGLRILHA